METAELPVLLVKRVGQADEETVAGKAAYDLLAAVYEACRNGRAWLGDDVLDVLDIQQESAITDACRTIWNVRCNQGTFDKVRHVGLLEKVDKAVAALPDDWREPALRYFNAVLEIFG